MPVELVSKKIPTRLHHSIYTHTRILFMNVKQIGSVDERVFSEKDTVLALYIHIIVTRH
jgi:hypothetical protein